MPSRRSPHWAYVYAVLGTLLVITARATVEGSYGTLLTSVTFIFAVLVAGAAGGWKPGVLTTVLCAAAAIYLFIEPAYSFRVKSQAALLGLVAYVVGGVAISVLCEGLHLAWGRIEERQRRLEQEIAERRRAEQASQVALDKLKIVTESMSALVNRCSREFRYLWVSKSYADWIGRDADEIIGCHLSEVIGQEAFDQLRPYFDRVLSGEEVRYEEAANFSRQGRRWINAVYSPTLDATGAVDGWVGVLLDIEEQKQAEMKLRNSEERLAAELDAMLQLHAVSTRLLASRDLETALDEVLDAANTMSRSDMGCVHLYDPDTGELRIVAQRGLPSQALEQLRIIPLEDFSPCSRAAASGERVVVEDVLNEPAFAAYRETASAAGFCSIQCTPLMRGNGELLGTLSTLCRAPHALEERELRLLDLLVRLTTDSIERTRAEEELQKADRRKDEFLATLAHELRNPLAPISSALEIIRVASEEPELVFQARCTMERQLKQMVRLVDDLLDVSRITRGTIALSRECVELTEILRSATETSQPLIDASGHQLSIDLPSEPVFVEADVTRLSQVFANLLNNAAKYTDPGGRIDLTVTADPGEVVVSVKDTGIGIPPSMLDGVFEMFSQVDCSLEKAHGGLGIGLTIAKRLVEMHGGTIEPHSGGPQQGSEFIVRLPRASSDLAESPSAKHGPHISLASRKSRILVVDDNKDAAHTLSMLLRMEGNDVRMVHDGLDAVKMARAFQPNVVLLDIGLPKMNGFDAARRIRKELRDDVVLIAVTGWGDEEHRLRSKQAGFDYHLTKPIELDALEGLIAGLQPS